MDLEKIKKLAAKFGVRIDDSPIAKEHNLYQGRVAFYREHETVKHCLWDPEKECLCLVSVWPQWERGGYIEAIAVALTCSHAPASLLQTIREVEATLD